ncbi:nuclear cap-binding protein subunit 1 [Drosophila teissieri]|uniref:nuclear cap-binding protein subunit 1 n=1 Tax=Drosophila teissieri TaxID=7243 RepID=UPI001CBA30C5|nr:nuclear cap-binding protein subunit 1 [Drosophila teissieri]
METNTSGRRKRQDSADGEEETDLRLKRTAETKAATVERLMRGLGLQGGISLELKLANLSYLSYLLSKGISGELKKHIMSLLITCVGSHPGQASVYATFVGLLNVGDFDFASECLSFMLQKAYESMHTRDWSKCRGVVHFLVDLYNCQVIPSSSLLTLLAAFLKECEALRDPDDVVVAAPQTRRDWLAYCVLSAMPLIGRDLEGEAAFEKLMVSVQIYIKKRCALHTTMLSVWRDLKQRDSLELLWQQVDGLRQEHWAEPEHQLIPRPYMTFDETLSHGQMHYIRDFQLAPHEQGCRYPPPRVCFRIFSYDSVGEILHLPSPVRIERHLLEAQIQDMLHSYHKERRICADSLLGYAASKPQLPVYHCIVEVILGEMLQLPTAQWININYGALLVQLCKGQPDKVPQVVVQAMDILFNRLGSMSVACFDRLVNWVSHHISNFGFICQWSKWAQSLPSPIDPSATNLQPKVVFLRELIKKCLRFSYHQRIAEILPDTLAGFLPPPALPHFKFVDETLPGAILSKILLEAMRSKQSCPEMISEIISATTGIGPLLKINVFTQNCLHLGSKSFSHTFAILSKYHSVFKDLAAGDPEKQLAILNGIFDVWVASDQYKFVVSEKLVKMEIIEPISLVTWIFDPMMRQELTKMYVWELLHSTVRHLKRVQHAIEVVDVDDPSASDSLVKGILLSIIQRFVKTLSGAPVADEGTEEHYWFQWVLGRLQETLFIYADDCKTFSSKLLKICEASEDRPEISKTIEAFVAYIM